MSPAPGAMAGAVSHATTKGGCTASLDTCLLTTAEAAAPSFGPPAQWNWSIADA